MYLRRQGLRVVLHEIKHSESQASARSEIDMREYPLLGVGSPLTKASLRCLEMSVGRLSTTGVEGQRTARGRTNNDFPERATALVGENSLKCIQCLSNQVRL